MPTNTGVFSVPSAVAGGGTGAVAEAPGAAPFLSHYQAGSSLSQEMDDADNNYQNLQTCRRAHHHLSTNSATASSLGGGGTAAARDESPWLSVAPYHAIHQQGAESYVMAADLKDRKEDEAVTGKKKNDDDMASITIHPPVLTPGKTTGTAKQQQTVRNEGKSGGRVEEKRRTECGFISPPAINGIRTRSGTCASGAKHQRRAKRALPLTSAPDSRIRTRQYYRILPIEDETVAEEEEGDTHPHECWVGLCLGMIRMTDKFMEGYEGCADPMLDVAAARDTSRMRILEKETGMDILALCDSRELRGVDHVSLGRREKGKHVSGRFENPPLRAIKRALGKRKISFIFGDYIRFPTAYFRPVYRAVANVLLPALERSGLLAPECQVYLPFLNLYNGVENVFERVMADRTLTPVLVSERENPLYRATKTLFDEDHVHKCEGLMPGTSFLRLTIKSTNS